MQRLAYSFLISFLSITLLLQWYQRTEYNGILLGVFAIIALFAILKKLTIISLLLGVSLSLIVVSLTTHINTPTAIDTIADGTKQTVEGIIIAEPDRRPLHTKYTLQVEGREGYVLLNDYRNWPQYEYGDRILATGKLEIPEPIEGFAYDNYLARYGIYAVMYRAAITLKKHPDNVSVRRQLYALKTACEKRINLLYPEPYASFMAGLLTGSRKGIPQDLMEAFNTTGLTHIIAISGYNISIVIALMSSSLFWLHPGYRLMPSVLAIVAFTVFVGASAAVIRAAIMGVLGLIALHSSRISQVRLTMLWAAFFMIVCNPKVLWYDAGFQLSFLAVIGVTELAPVLDPLFVRVPRMLGIREALQLTVAAQLTAVPWMLVLFQRVSLVAPLANVLIAPAIPLAMLFGCLSIIISTISATGGMLVAYLAWSCLEWIVQIATILSTVPLASVSLNVPAWSSIPYYLGLGFTIHKASIAWCQPTKVRASTSSASSQEI